MWLQRRLQLICRKIRELGRMVFGAVFRGSEAVRPFIPCLSVTGYRPALGGGHLWSEAAPEEGDLWRRNTSGGLGKECCCPEDRLWGASHCSQHQEGGSVEWAGWVNSASRCCCEGLAFLPSFRPATSVCWLFLMGWLLSQPRMAAALHGGINF